MAWVQIQDEMPDHPKLKRAGPLGLALYIAGLCYCNRHLTDGFIPLGAAETLVCWKFWGEPEECNGVTNEKVFTIDIGCGMRGESVTNELVIERLCRSGLWEEEGGGYRVHDYLEHQTSRQEVMEKRAAINLRVGEHRRRGRNANCNAVGNAVSNADVTLTRRQKTEDRRQKKEEEESKSTHWVADATENAPSKRKRPQPKASNPPSYPDGFMVFWEGYSSPRRRKKPEALHWWKKHGCESMLAEVVEGLEVYKRSQQWLDGYEVEPARWLKKRQWEDEPGEEREEPRDGYRGAVRVEAANDDAYRDERTAQKKALDRQAALEASASLLESLSTDPEEDKP